MTVYALESVDGVAHLLVQIFNSLWCWSTCGLDFIKTPIQYYSKKVTLLSMELAFYFSRLIVIFLKHSCSDNLARSI